MRAVRKSKPILIKRSQNIFLVELWESAEHQQAYMGWRVETGFMDAVGPLLDGARLLEHSISEAISDGRSEAIMQRKVFRSGPYAELIAQACRWTILCICPDKLALMPTVPHLTAWWNKHRWPTST